MYIPHLSKVGLLLLMNFPSLQCMNSEFTTKSREIMSLSNTGTGRSILGPNTSITSVYFLSEAQRNQQNTRSQEANDTYMDKFYVEEDRIYDINAEFKYFASSRYENLEISLEETVDAFQRADTTQDEARDPLRKEMYCWRITQEILQAGFTQDISKLHIFIAKDAHNNHNNITQADVPYFLQSKIENLPSEGFYNNISPNDIARYTEIAYKDLYPVYSSHITWKALQRRITQENIYPASLKISAATGCQYQ